MSPELKDAATVAGWLADRFDEDRIDYAIGGALGLGAFGVPRMTKDVGFTVYLSTPEYDRLFEALERGGCIFDRGKASQVAAKQHLFRARCGRIWVDLFITSFAHDHATRDRRVQLTFKGRKRWFVSLDDQIVHKLTMNRPKDIDDLKKLFAVQRANIDVAYVREWLEKLFPDPNPRHSVFAELQRKFLS